VAIPRAVTVTRRPPATPPTLDERERRRLDAYADALVPPRADRPAASSVGVADELLDVVLHARPDVGAPLRRALAHDAGDTAAALAGLASSDPEALAAVEFVTAAGYYLSERVRRSIGYPGQLALPLPLDSSREYIDEGLLAHVLSSPSARPHGLG
jgi:hypothetical protein